jgi:uncharacterized protein (DUF2235 family)
MEATDYILAGTPERENAVAQDAATRENFGKTQGTKVLTLQQSLSSRRSRYRILYYR